MARSTNLSWNVRPRFTPGSPAMVSWGLALRVAWEELRAFQHAFDGTMGAAGAELAKGAGLAWIAEETCERRGLWEVHDLLTSERYDRPIRVKAGQVFDRFDPIRGWLKRWGRAERSQDGVSFALRPITEGDGWREVEEIQRGVLRYSDSVRVPDAEDEPRETAELRAAVAAALAGVGR